jgi:transcriptional regulator with XRE-family HTH domain
VTTQLSLFGPELRRRRLAAGLSLTQLAERVHYSKSYLSKIETVLKPPNASLARRCDAVLEAGGELSALVQRPEPEVAASARLDPVDDGEEWVVSVVATDGTAVFLPMRRRDVLSLGAASFLGIGLTTRATAVVARDGSSLSTFGALFDNLRRLGQTDSPGTVLPNAIMLTQTLRGKAATAGAAARTGLLLLAGRCAEYAGWMAQEAGEERIAAWWTDRATELAGAAGDRDLAAYALVRQAEIMLYRDDARRTVELARRAQQYPGTLARVRGLAAQREAQGHALAGDYDRCRRLLDLAAGLLGSTEPGPGRPAAPTLGSSTVPNLDEVITAWCLHDLGRPGEAAQILDREVPRIPLSARRARARFGARRALAHAEAGDVEQACTVAGDLLTDVELVDSATIRLDLRRLARELARRHTHPDVRDFQPRLTAALHRTGE